MTSLLIRLFLRGRDPTGDGRHAYGRLAGATGLAANLLLFAGKLLTGLLSGSIAVTADAFNNLSDAGSSLVTLAGFKLSSAPPDREHPFGHGRIEYLTAMAVAVMILIAGLELAKSSLDRLLHPADTAFGVVSAVILAAAIAVKLWMALFYRKVGRLIDSAALAAAAADSRNDVLCTAVVLATSLLGRATGWQLDGAVGMLVALFVLWSGVSMVRQAVSPLLGQAPDRQLADSIRRTVLAHEDILGVHDLIVHNYGPGRYIISLHAEVPADGDIMKSHDLVDRVEKELADAYHAVVCIHMDPVDIDNPRVLELKSLVAKVLGDMDPTLILHDFRVVFGETHTNLIFDLVVPFEYPAGSDADAARQTTALTGELQRRIWACDDTLFIVVTVEHSFT